MKETREWKKYGYVVAGWWCGISIKERGEREREVSKWINKVELRERKKKEKPHNGRHRFILARCPRPQAPLDPCKKGNKEAQSHTYILQALWIG